MKILITGSFPITQQQIQQLSELGLEVSLHQNEREAVQQPDRYEAVVCNGLFLYNAIEKFTALKYVQLTSVGLDRVPLDFIHENGIVINNARGVYSVPMAEFAICGVLQLLKRSKFFMKNQSLHSWEKHRNVLELMGRTVCVVGCGSVGTECAKRFKAFDCNIIGVDIYPREDENYDKIFELDHLHHCLSYSDIVILTLPLTEGTKHLLNEQAFGAMKKGAILVNIARGGVVDTNALIHALDTVLEGAVLDVFEDEPLFSENPLWDLENVIITPHNSFVSEANQVRLWDVIYSNLRRFLSRE